MYNSQDQWWKTRTTVRYATDMLMTKMQTLVLVSQLIGSQKIWRLRSGNSIDPPEKKEKKERQKTISRIWRIPSKNWMLAKSSWQQGLKKIVKSSLLYLSFRTKKEKPLKIGKSAKNKASSYKKEKEKRQQEVNKQVLCHYVRSAAWITGLVPSAYLICH